MKKISALRSLRLCGETNLPAVSGRGIQKIKINLKLQYPITETRFQFPAEVAFKFFLA
jgi:hypothetical protein